jgi:serine/threonine protein phosphatase PrpC
VKLTSEVVPVELVSIYIEKVVGEGEDSKPLCKILGRSCLIGVFDGLGGSGSVKYHSDGRIHSGAYFASRLVRKTLSNLSFYTSGPPIDLVESLVSDQLIAFDISCGRPRSAFRGRSLRVLPTTAAVADVRPIGATSSWCVRAFWCGDSRLYILRPADGLQQVTSDHLVSRGDPLQNLDNDSRMTRCVSADKKVEFEDKGIRVDPPAIVLAATDGCFQYLPSPMHFEHLLLSSLLEANSLDEWGQILRDSLSRIAQDDATLVAVGLGLPAGFEDVKHLFRPRQDHVASHYIEALDVLFDGRHVEPPSEGRHRLDYFELRAELWNQYKGTYLRLADYGNPIGVTAEAVVGAKSDRPGHLYPKEGA